MPKEEKVEEITGKPKTDWQKRRIDSTISKIRKRLRLSNPEMENTIIYSIKERDCCFSTVLYKTYSSISNPQTCSPHARSSTDGIT